MVLTVLLWIHIQRFLCKSIVLPHFGLDACLTVKCHSFWISAFSRSVAAQRDVQMSVRRGQRRAEGVLSFEMPHAIVLPPFLAFSFFNLSSLNHRCQKKKKKNANRHYITLVAATQGLLQVALNFFPPWLEFFLPFFSECLGHNFQMIFIIGLCCQSWLFVKQSKNLNDKSRYLKM